MDRCVFAAEVFDPASMELKQHKTVLLVCPIVHKTRLRFGLLIAACLVSTCMGFGLATQPAFAQTSQAVPVPGKQFYGKKTNSDWPCQQILVKTISVPAVWTGPSIDGAAWQSDPKLADLIDRLAARRLPLEDAQHEVTGFAKTLGADKQQKLTGLFAGLYAKLNNERALIIDGLERFGHRQKELADRLREETAALHTAQDQAGGSPLPDMKDKSEPASAPGPEATLLEKLQWDLKIYQDRHKAVSFVCESPVLIEQRLFALARTIQENLN